MVKVYVDRLSAFIERASPDKFGGVHLECKHFFGGAALYAEGQFCISLTPAGLALKLPEETRKCLLESGRAVPLRYFPNAPIKKDYVLFPDGIEPSGDDLGRYVRESIKYGMSHIVA